MSVKPSDAGRFAVNGSDVDAVNISAPSSGLRDTGFTNNYVPPAAEFNYLENIAYRWRQYLNDGNLSGAFTFDSTVGITGALTMGVNSSVTISGTGKYKHGTRSITYPVVLSKGGIPGGGDTGPTTNVPPVSWNFIQPGTTTATAGNVYYPIILDTGKRILSWSVSLLKNTSNAFTITGTLFRDLGLSGVVIGVAQTNNLNAPGSTTIGQSGLTETVLASQYYVAVTSPDSSTANGVDIAFELTVTYDQP